MSGNKLLRFIVVILLNICMVALVACMGEVEHTHTFSDGWSSDQFHHWKSSICKHSGEKTFVEEHVYDSDSDTLCNICKHTRLITPKEIVLSLDNYQQYLQVKQNIYPDSSSGFILTFDFCGLDYYRYENVTIKYQLFSFNYYGDYMVLDDNIEEYTLQLNLGGYGKTIEAHGDWRLNVLSISGKVKKPEHESSKNYQEQLNINNYQQFLSFDKIVIKDKADSFLYLWEINGVKGCIFENVKIEYNYYIRDQFGNEWSYEEFYQGFYGVLILELPTDACLTMEGNGSTLYVDNNEIYIKIISISGVVKY